MIFRMLNPVDKFGSKGAVGLVSVEHDGQHPLLGLIIIVREESVHEFLIVKDSPHLDYFRLVCIPQLESLDLYKGISIAYSGCTTLPGP